jgi:6-phosphogluconolactonase
VAREQLRNGREVLRFGSRGELARALAGQVADVLGQAVSRRGAGFVAVSGGTTPAAFFAELAGRPLDWERIVVTLVDERLVPPDSSRANQLLVRERLLVGPAARARFVPLFEGGSTEGAAARAEIALRDLPWPLDAAILGMGVDGHTASFFPDAENLEALLDPRGAKIVLPVKAAGAAEQRLTLTLPALAKAGLLALHIEGEEKAAVLERVLLGGETLPVGAVFDQATVKVFWAA